jgi:hypothetical protein
VLTRATDSDPTLGSSSVISLISGPTRQRGYVGTVATLVFTCSGSDTAGRSIAVNSFMDISKNSCMTHDC